MTTAADRARAARTQRLVTLVLTVGGVLLAGFLVYALIYAFTLDSGPDPFDATLPNPMGGPARTAPGTTTGSLDLAGLHIDGTDVAMGDVPLGVTLVPAWDVTNPTADPITLTIGQPQVVEGCCPGPVYADGTLTQPGDQVTVDPGGSTHLQFPLQMHPGMDGPHHLQIPLTANDTTDTVHVTGNFTADA